MAKKTILQSWSKRLRHLIIYTRSVHFPIIPLPPWTVCNGTGQKLKKNLLKCMKFNFFQGGGRGKFRHSLISNCKLKVTLQFPTKKGRGRNKRSVSNTFDQDSPIRQLLARVSKTVFFRTFFNKSLA